MKRPKLFWGDVGGRGGGRIVMRPYVMRALYSLPRGVGESQAICSSSERMVPAW